MYRTPYYLVDRTRPVLPVPATAYNLANWYRVGAEDGPSPYGYYSASQDGPEYRTAYTAGVIARAFGVDLSPSL